MPKPTTSTADAGTRVPAVPMTFGVEEEFLVVDRGSGALACRSDALIDAAAPALGDRVAPELNLCQIEVNTDICTELGEAHADLLRLRRGLTTSGAETGLTILPSGTHPTSAWSGQRVNREHERYARMEDRFQIVARQQVICGCHVHIGFDDPELAVATMNRSRPWLPVLLALSANSPFWSGEDTGFASYRTEVWQRWPTAGFGPHLESRADFDRLVRELQAIGAIEDTTYLYWYMRPSSRYPTVEFRICDVPLHVEDTVTLAGLIRALAWTGRRDAIAGGPVPYHRTEALEAAMWRAARYGLSDELVHPVEARTAPAAEVVDRLLDFVGDGLDAHGDRDAVTAGVAEIFRRGNGAAQQRAAFARLGSTEAVVLATLTAQGSCG